LAGSSKLKGRTVAFWGGTGTRKGKGAKGFFRKNIRQMRGGDISGLEGEKITQIV